LTETEFQELHDLQIRYRMDWPAVFSVTPRGDEIWPWVVNGLTPPSVREDVKGVSSVLDGVAECFLGIRDEQGGRFFVDDRGAFYKPQREEIQFVEFKFLR
jgi:hypothetical protein